MSTTNTATAAAMPTPIQHRCPHMPGPVPLPMPHPPIGPPIGRPPIGPLPPKPFPPVNPPSPYPPGDSMRDLEGGSVKDIARGILDLYDRDRNGTISADEATRVERTYGRTGIALHGGDAVGGAAAMHRPPFPGGGTRVDVYSMTRLLFAADANHNGKVGVNELTRHLRSFDTGDSWRGKGIGPKLVPMPHDGAGDGRLSGSEFQHFMQRSGEQHVAGWNEPAWRRPWHGYDPIPLHALAGDVQDALAATGAAAPQVQEAAQAVAEQAAAAPAAAGAQTDTPAGD